VLSEAPGTTSDALVAVQPALEVERFADAPRSVESSRATRVAPSPIETSAPTPESVAAESPAPQTAFALPNTRTLCAGIWFLGLVAIPCAIMLSHLRMTRRLLRSSSPPPGWVMDTPLEDLRTEFRIVAWPSILLTPKVHSPTLLGASHPKNFLPTKLVEESSPAEMRLFLLHELTHLRSGDIWFSWLWCLALSIHWFNPLMCWAGTRIRKDRELACDEAVLQQIGIQAKKETPVELSAFIQAVDTHMQMIEKRFTRGDAYRDKSDLTSVYGNWKQENLTPSEAELKQMIRDLSTYAEAHADNEIYGWRIWHLKSLISRDTKDEPSLGDGIRPSFNYLWEVTAHYPHTKYPISSKHSKFQHLVNELAMMVWDKDGLDAAEEYLVETWKSERRFVNFFDSPWRRRM
jgi:hypothetical protein